MKDCIVSCQAQGFTQTETRVTDHSNGPPGLIVNLYALVLHSSNGLQWNAAPLLSVPVGLRHGNDDTREGSIGL